MYQEIRKAIAKQNMTLAELAERSNVPLQAVKDAMNRDEFIQANYIYRMEQALGIRQ